MGVVIAGIQPQAPFIVAGMIAIGSIFLLLGVSLEAKPISTVGQPQSFVKTLIILKNDRTMILFTLGCLLSTLVPALLDCGGHCIVHRWPDRLQSG